MGPGASVRQLRVEKIGVSIRALSGRASTTNTGVGGGSGFGLLHEKPKCTLNSEVEDQWQDLSDQESTSLTHQTRTSMSAFREHRIKFTAWEVGIGDRSALLTKVVRYTIKKRTEKFESRRASAGD